MKRSGTLRSRTRSRTYPASRSTASSAPTLTATPTPRSSRRVGSSQTCWHQSRPRTSRRQGCLRLMTRPGWTRTSWTPAARRSTASPTSPQRVPRSFRWCSTTRPSSRTTALRCQRTTPSSSRQWRSWPPQMSPQSSSPAPSLGPLPCPSLVWHRPMSWVRTRTGSRNATRAPRSSRTPSSRAQPRNRGRVQRRLPGQPGYPVPRARARDRSDRIASFFPS